MIDEPGDSKSPKQAVNIDVVNLANIIFGLIGLTFWGSFLLAASGHGLPFLICFLVFAGLFFASGIWVSILYNDTSEKKPMITLRCCLFFILLVFLGGLRPNTGYVGKKAYQRFCGSHLRQISLGLQQYAMEYNGYFPPVNGTPGLEYLRKLGYVTDTKIYMCPSTKTRPAPTGPLSESSVDYIYVGAGHHDKESPSTPIVWDNPRNHEKYGNVLFANGEVVEGTGDNWLTDACKKQDNKKVNK